MKCRNSFIIVDLFLSFVGDGVKLGLSMSFDKLLLERKKGKGESSSMKPLGASNETCL
jgi:hypothetical protein